MSAKDAAAAADAGEAGALLGGPAAPPRRCRGALLAGAAAAAAALLLAAWRGGAGGVRHPGEVGAAVVRLGAAGSTWEGNGSCACIGGEGLEGRHRYANKVVPQSFGGDCAMWDKILDECQVAEPPDHCWRGWCFVDPCSCNLSIPPRPSKLLQGVLFHGRPIHYSYSTCGEASPEEAGEAVKDRSSVEDACQLMPHEVAPAGPTAVPV